MSVTSDPPLQTTTGYKGVSLIVTHYGEEKAEVEAKKQDNVTLSCAVHGQVVGKSRLQWFTVKTRSNKTDLITDGELVSGKHGRDYVATEEKNNGWVLNITFKAERETYKDYMCQLQIDDVDRNNKIDTVSSPIMKVKDRKKSRGQTL